MAFTDEEKRVWNLQNSIKKGKKIYKTKKRADDELKRKQKTLQDTPPVTLEQAMLDNERKAMLMADAEGLRSPRNHLKPKKFREGDLVQIKKQFLHLFFDTFAERLHPPTCKCLEFSRTYGWSLIFVDGPHTGKCPQFSPEACLERV